MNVPDVQARLITYTSDSPLRRPGFFVKEMFRDLWTGRELSWRLAVRDISAQYRQTALGLLWAFILPLSNALVWIFLNANGVVKVITTGLPYPVYALTGTMIWAIFIDAANAPLQQATAAKPMLAKINFPRESLIVSGVYQTFFNAGIKLLVLLPVMMIMGIFPNWELVMFPVALISLILSGTAFGLMLTPIGLLYNDIGKSFPVIMQFLMYLTPVVFAMPEHGWAAVVYRYNPLTPILVTARDWLTGLPTEYLPYFALVSSIFLIVLLAMWVMFRVAIPFLIERMSA